MFIFSGRFRPWGGVYALGRSGEVVLGTGVWLIGPVTAARGGRPESRAEAWRGRRSRGVCDAPVEDAVEGGVGRAGVHGGLLLFLGRDGGPSR